MTDIIASQSGFIVLLSFFAVGAIGALFFRNKDELANTWSSIFSIIGSVWGILFALSVFNADRDVFFSVGTSSFHLLSLSFHIDALSSFFIFVVSLISLFCSIYGFGYVKHFYKKYNIGVLGFFYNLFIGGMFLVVSASNGLFFLIAWEIMSVTSYFLVVYDRNEHGNAKAGFMYLAMTHAGTAFIIFSFLLLYKFTGSFEFGAIKANISSIPFFIKNLIFVSAIIGFGTKAGIVPFHIWLPSAHPAAPSHVSGLMSGVMIKTGIFMMIRVFLDLLQPVPVWWGLTILIIGAVSSLLGVLYALTEHDLKKLLAYHSIENIGIILLGLGGSLTFLSLGMTSLALLSLVAALFHTLNHAIFKSLLFLGAGSVINQTHTRNIEKYGGLIRYMPQTALFFLIGSMAISALPPFNGFFSEWLTFQSLFQGVALLGSYSKWIFMLAAGSLAFTGGLALACFVKAFGATFSARPRSPEVQRAKESSPSMVIGMASLSVLTLLFGVFSGYLSSIIGKIAKGLSVFSRAPSFISVSLNQSITTSNGFSSVSAPAMLTIFVATIIVIFIVVKYFIYRRQAIKIGPTWNCGTEMTPRMEITATGFSRSIIMIFKGVLKPSLQHEIEYHDAESRYLPKSRKIILGVSDIYQLYFYKLLNNLIVKLSQLVRKLQSGVVNAYILYIFIALLVVLFSTIFM